MQDEHRLAEKLTNYWWRSRAGKAFPTFEAYFSGGLGSDVWQHCAAFSISKTSGKPLFLCEYIGEQLSSALAEDISGQVLTLLRASFQGARILEKTPEVMKSREPTTDAGHFINMASKIIKFRSCLLPLGRNEEITHVVLGLSWRAF